MTVNTNQCGRKMKRFHLLKFATFVFMKHPSEEEMTPLVEGVKCEFPRRRDFRMRLNITEEVESDSTFYARVSGNGMINDGIGTGNSGGGQIGGGFAIISLSVVKGIQPVANERRSSSDINNDGYLPYPAAMKPRLLVSKKVFPCSDPRIVEKHNVVVFFNFALYGDMLTRTDTKTAVLP